MDFVFTEEQVALRETARAALTRLGGLGISRRVADSPEEAGEVRDRLWELAVQAGWLGLGVAEEDGGSGGGAIEQVLTAMELGRVAAPISLTNCVMTASALSSGNAHRSRLSALSEGICLTSWGIAELGSSWTTQSPGIKATADVEGWTLSGDTHYVLDADSATELIVAARGDDGEPLVIIVPLSGPSLSVRAQQTLDVTRSLSHVNLNQARAIPGNVLAHGEHAVTMLRQVVWAGALITAAESLGAAEQLIEMTLSYLKERSQFGRQLASFQALKHRCADMKIQLETTRALVLLAAMHHRDQTSEARKMVSMAKARTARACVQIAGEALQLHGGIGMTWEHNLHLLLRRIRVNAALFGGAAEHRELALSTVLKERTGA